MMEKIMDLNLIGYYIINYAIQPQSNIVDDKMICNQGVSI